jgi:hypothetical protein
VVNETTKTKKLKARNVSNRIISDGHQALIKKVTNCYDKCLKKHVSKDVPQKLLFRFETDDGDEFTMGDFDLTTSMSDDVQTKIVSLCDSFK